MNIIATDDERMALQVLTAAIAEAIPDAEIHSFESAEDALAFCSDHPCEIAFLDIDMGGMSGIVAIGKICGKV